MQKGSVVLATTGLILTLIGTTTNEWLNYKPENWEARDYRKHSRVTFQSPISVCCKNYSTPKNENEKTSTSNDHPKCSSRRVIIYLTKMSPPSARNIRVKHLDGDKIFEHGPFGCRSRFRLKVAHENMT